MNALTAQWNYPTRICCGPGEVKSLPEKCFELGFRSPLLVTDPGLIQLPMTQALLDNCKDAGLALGTFSQVKANPNGQNVYDGVRVYQDGEHDGVIALGGGSAIDAAKAIALMSGQDRPLWDFEDVGDNWLRVREEGMARVIAIPTTAGTGSEVGRASVITDEETQCKRIIFHPKMLPELVILDAELTLGLPPAMTAATGMDALSHSLEAFCSNAYHPMAEGIALESMRLIHLYLPRAFDDGRDVDARQQMLVASAMGATAFQRGLGGMHAIAHALGALYDAHHGTLNAVLMPYVLRANTAAISERLGRVAHYLQLPEPCFESFLSWVLDMRSHLQIPHRLSEMNIDTDMAERVGRMAEADAAASGNPIAFSAQHYQCIFEAAVEGRLDDLPKLLAVLGAPAV
ncbi:MAG: alcohol dehydrogenase [Oleiphilus sp.]|nr:MAG: alcohol dehydrogenase [Oleiphilus sp.]